MEVTPYEKPEPKTPSQSGRDHSQHDSLRNQATGRDTSNQPRDEDFEDTGVPGATGRKGQPGQRGAQDEQPLQSADGMPWERQDGASNDSLSEESLSEIERG
jgi:hypothetical protein